MTTRRTRQRLGIIGLSTAVVAGSLAFTAGPAAAQIDPEENRSHLLCYQGKMGGFPSGPGQPTISLTDFLTTTDATVEEGVAFCNPVRKKKGRKVVSDIVSVRQHAKLYAVDPEGDFGITPVLYDNQLESLTVRNVGTQPAALLVPSRKFPHRFPNGFDHYACHFMEPAAVWSNPTFKLRDQFANHRGTTVFEPFLFCAAAEKRHDGRTFTPREELVHYVCYFTERKPIAKQKRRSSNQFEKRKRFTAKVANLLCVPSLGIVASG